METKAVVMRGRSFVLSFVVLLLLSVSLFAELPACKGKNGAVKVAYPDLARKMKIGGVVRLELQLTSTGSVHDSKVLGGNPMLVSAAQQAVKQAQFEGHDTCIAVFEFNQ